MVNTSLAMVVFSFVEYLLFWNAHEKDGEAVVHDTGGMDLFSFVEGSCVELCIVQACDCFTLVRHDAGGLVFLF